MYKMLCVRNISCSIAPVIGSTNNILRATTPFKIRAIPIQNFANSAKNTKVTNEFKIYEGPLSKQIRMVKVFSLTSSAAGLLCQPIIFKQAATIGSTSLLIGICSVIGFFTFVTPLLLHFITKKYVIELTYNPDKDKYTATTISLFLARKEMEFKAEDVVVPEIPGMFTTFVAKGTPLFVEARFFSDPSYYADLMGYDKPLDLKLSDPENERLK